ncbi:MAG: helix-turn-helix domain-containing protein [Clostridium sp.]|nr:helix-turn-helix domain-containing protein [Clostridium sp.]MCM1172407.1 helix-turn-helix domain-containing protein [Clostridium sp.]MCM1208635.1 helix-turn-helix domain-containing protein [Ruminococcus sp.]
MNQEKIGKHIADMRKKQNLTQKQMADLLCVTDKAVSKWECGKSMPEISKIEPLCNVLNISVNELLSGECIEEPLYSKKAEENMLQLISECEDNEKTGGASIVVVMSMLAVLFCIGYTIAINIGFEDGYKWIDVSSVMTLIFVTLIYLLSTRTMKPFFRSFVIGSKKRSYLKEEIYSSMISVKLVQRTMLTTGFLISLLSYISTNIMVSDASFDGYIVSNFAVASLGFLYGIIAFLLLIPIRAKLELYLGLVMGEK